MIQIRCKSGLMGWQARLQEVYDSYDQFVGYCVHYNIHTKLKFKSMENCWKANPVVQGSVNPTDLRKVRR